MRARPATPAAASHTLIAFYAGTGRDGAGRTIDEVLAFTFDELEDVHDYIQWLFPLFERSGANPGAPVLDDESVGSLRREPALRRRMRTAFELMLAFYGLQLSTSGGTQRIERTDVFPVRAKVWLTPRNHNFLRLSRILHSLCIMNGAALARMLLSALEEIDRDFPGVVGERTRDFWRNAVPR